MILFNMSRRSRRSTRSGKKLQTTCLKIQEKKLHKLWQREVITMHVMSLLTSEKDVSNLAASTGAAKNKFTTKHLRTPIAVCC